MELCAYVLAILHDCIAIQGVLVGTVFNGLLAELPAILDSFFTSTTSRFVQGRRMWALEGISALQKLYSDGCGPI